MFHRVPHNVFSCNLVTKAAEMIWHLNFVKSLLEDADCRSFYPCKTKILMLLLPGIEEEGIPLIRRFLACLCVVMLISAFGQTICGPNELAVDIEE